MKKIIITFLLLVLFPLNVLALDISSECIVVMDTNSKRVLYSKNMDKQRLIASITKIMTAIIAIESKNLDDIVVIDKTIEKSFGSNIYIEVGESMNLKDLLYGLMLRSGNDAALMIAKYVGGSEKNFVKMMNKKAHILGMENTTFSNPSGLDNETENISTAYDMALLTSYAMKNDNYRKIVKTKKHIVKTDYKSYVWENKNKLLRYDFITGGKTGYTEKANRTLVSTGMIDNMELVIVTLNDGNDFVNHKNMYDKAFKTYNQYKILNKNKLNLNVPFYNDDIVYIKNDFYYPIKKSEKDKLYTKIKIEKKQTYRDNQKIGEIIIYNKNKVIHTESVYVRKKDEKNWFMKLKDIFS